MSTNIPGIHVTESNLANLQKLTGNQDLKVGQFIAKSEIKVFDDNKVTVHELRKAGIGEEGAKRKDLKGIAVELMNQAQASIETNEDGVQTAKDQDGNILYTITPNDKGSVKAYGENPQKPVKEETFDQEGNVTSTKTFEYDEEGNLCGTVTEEGTVITVADKDGKPTSKTVDKGGGVTEITTYEYDAANLTKETVKQNGTIITTTKFGSTSKSVLQGSDPEHPTSYEDFGLDNKLQAKGEFRYDEAGNETYSKMFIYEDDGTTLNRTIVRGDGVVELVANKDGNVTKRELENETTEIVYGENGAPTKVTIKNPEGEAVYEANESGQLVRTVGGGVENLTLDPKTGEVTKDVVKNLEPTPEEPNYKELLTKTGNQVTIDETGSTQRLNSKAQWDTRVVLPKDYTGEGKPSKISIALPGAYGQKDADGKTQVRYQTLILNEKTGRYADRAGLREFELNVGDDGKITLKQYNPDNDKVKSTLDKWNTKNSQDTRKAAIQEKDNAWGHKEKIEIETKEQANELLEAFSNRNLSAAAYANCGSNNGRITRDHGPIEHMMKKDFVTQYADVKAAIDGMRASIPENADTMQDGGVLAQFDALNTALQAPDGFTKSNMRNLETLYMDIIKNHMPNAQGTSYSPNNWLRSAGGVMIEPDKSASIVKTDAKFIIGEGENQKNFYLHNPRDSFGIANVAGRTYDFQNIAGVYDESKVLTENDAEGNPVTTNNNPMFAADLNANNRHGAIRVNDQKLIGKIFQQDTTGPRYEVVEHEGRACIEKANGTFVLVEDIMNGKATMDDCKAL